MLADGLTFPADWHFSRLVSFLYAVCFDGYEEMLHY